MDFKYVDVSDEVSIPVPKGLTPEEEANFLAGRMAYVNINELELECREAIRLLNDGKLVSIEPVLEQLERELIEESGDVK